MNWKLEKQNCAKKKKYSDKKEAQTVLNLVKYNVDGGLRIYPCPVCKKWHLTKNK